MKHLTLEQRYEISAMNKNGASQKDIAIALGKDKSTISRELKRNCDGRNGQYRATLAQTKCERRHKEKPKKEYLTTEIKQYVDVWINEEYSPEQIVGRALLQGLSVSVLNEFTNIFGMTKSTEESYTRSCDAKGENTVIEVRVRIAED